MAEQSRKDPQDQAFGAASREDQELVDELEKEGVTEDELPDQPARHPRAAGKAEVAPESHWSGSGLIASPVYSAPRGSPGALYMRRMTHEIGAPIPRIHLETCAARRCIHTNSYVRDPALYITRRDRPATSNTPADHSPHGLRRPLGGGRPRP